MSHSIENHFNWYEANNFNADSVLQAVISIFSGNYDSTDPIGDHGRVRQRGDTHHRFYGPLPGMFASRGIVILQDNRGLSISQMVGQGLLAEDVLRKLKPSYRFEYITNQDISYVEFAYHQDYPFVPDSPGLTLREQMGVAQNYCGAVMEHTTGIFPGPHNLRDTLAFVLAYHSLHGRYPIREAASFRTFDLLWVDGQVEYHPTVWLIKEGSEERLTVEVTRADSRDFGTVAPFFWKPSL